MRMRFALMISALLCGAFCVAAEPLPGTKLLEEQRPLDEVMIAGIDRFALRELEQSRELRESRWQPDFGSPEEYDASLIPLRQRFAEIIGAVDPRVHARGIELVATTESSSLLSDNESFRVDAVRWPVFEGVTAEGLFLRPKGRTIARVIALGDADWTPEMIAGLQPFDTHFAAELAARGCEVLVPTLINRDSTFSANRTIGRSTNLTHREFIYRQAFELGRHIIGYEVQKVLAGVDQFERRNEAEDLPIVVMGVSEGGLLALYSGALDTRIDATVVSGYFDERQHVWREPIYRNVWHLLTEFGDAQLAGLIAPRALFVEPSPAIPSITDPPQGNRNIAAPGIIERPKLETVSRELRRAELNWSRLRAEWGSLSAIQGLHVLPDSVEPATPPLTPATIARILAMLTGAPVDSSVHAEIEPAKLPDDAHAIDRQGRQVKELVDFTQTLLRHSHRERDKRFETIERTSLDSWVTAAEPVRQEVYEKLIGRLPTPTIDPDPRSRQVIDEPAFQGYEVVLDVYPDVIAAGILLLPKGMKEDEKRPVVVCQHGLEGTPMDTISGPDSSGYRAYKAFSAELARRGFIVYAPQNPYRGQDAFRTLQRKSNPLGRSLFSYIIPQHLVTLRWLSTLPNVDAERIGFYGLSYGGKTAMRVPPMLPPSDGEPGYCLSICSADFNEWVAKNASTDASFSYVWTGEYEIFEWNMGHVANYAELGMLMTPRPFMVERGHDDGVGIDEWVAWEYAKIRRHYNKLGIGDRTEIEFFDGPHTINGQGTYQFLHKHLNWPGP